MKKIKKIMLFSVLCFIGIMLVLQFGIKEDIKPVSVSQGSNTAEKNTSEKVPVTEKAEPVTVTVNEKKPEEKKEEVVVSTSEKGGFWDSKSFMKTLWKEVEFESKYEYENLRITCVRLGGTRHDGKCIDPIYFFNEDPTTKEDAFNQLKDHLPKDAVIEKEFQKDEKRYVYNMKSNLLKENHSGFPIPPKYQGEFHLILIKGPDDSYMGAQAKVGYYK
ncbi:hypothetical protein [Fredinandcohnia sp. 179-A 10B2 NHS]|uniref:hypothetical protein n=1 Tax=Fredinandcohnia sp. 179-A 10B2 NHS TaxID=3235176 RepID=UPI0039A3F6D3